jgi:TolA-binding protein
MKRPLALALAVLITTSVVAQTPSASPKPKTGRHSSSTAVSKTLQDMKEAISAQQQQIQQLQQQIQSRDQAIQQLQQQVGQAQSTAQQAQETANAAVPKAEDLDKQYMGTLEHDVADLKTVSGNTVNELQDAQKRIGGLESPLAIHYKGITLTPGGFLAAETVWRPHATLGDINTPLNSIPFSGAGQARVSEFYGSGRQSRISFLAQGKLANVNATGYVEADFLSAGVTSNPNQSNSYTFRQRQVWGQAAFSNGWTFTGGQMWSLVMETKVGLDNRTEALPMQIDAQYTAGLSWTRQYGFRATKNFNNKAWIGFSVENAQTLLTVSGAPSSTCGTSTCGNFLIGGPGTGGGLYNLNANYSSNVSPDFVVKAAFQPGWGHYEIFAVGSDFRERIYPGALLATPTAAGAFNRSVWGGGFGANARWLVAQKKVEFGVHYFGGNGVGRYGNATLPDVTVYGDGTEHLIRAHQGLASLEFHPSKWDFYLYGGGEYAGRQYSFYKGKPVGYGAPGFDNTGCGVETLPGTGGFLPGGLSKCAGQTRALLEATTGFWYKPYNGPKGRFQLGMQYSYLTRNAWSGKGGDPEAIENMIFTSFRYYLP